MDTNEKNLQKLTRLLSLMDEDALTKEQFVSSFKTVIDFIKKIEAKNVQQFKDIQDVLTKFSDKLKTDTNNEVGSLKDEVRQEVSKQVKNLQEAHEAKMSAVDMRMAEVKDGKDADEIIIAENASTMALERLKPLFMAKDTINAELPKYGAEIRDALELLQGDERLSIDAIDGLKELLETKGKAITSVGGGFNYGSLGIHIVDDETPTGTVNGVNTDFVLARTPSPATSLKVYKDGQRMKLTTDYTLSGKTISFVSAPLTDSIITCDYRT